MTTESKPAQNCWEVFESLMRNSGSGEVASDAVLCGIWKDLQEHVVECYKAKHGFSDGFNSGDVVRQVLQTFFSTSQPEWRPETGGIRRYLFRIAEEKVP